jgi:hypothetical protein
MLRMRPGMTGITKRNTHAALQFEVYAAAFFPPLANRP